MIVLNCKACNQSFESQSKSRMFCSMTCFNTVRSQHRRNRVNVICDICNITFECFPYRIAKYCSKDCWSKRNPPKVKECPFCKSEYVSYDKNSIYCSRTCARKSKTGKDANRYKDGKSLERERARLSPQIKVWRSAVYKRDNYTCQMCGDTKQIHAHHIKEWATHPENRFDVDNGLTVCIHCHGKIHNKNFANRRKKTCSICQQKTSGRSKYCKSCGVKQAWINKKALPLFQNL